MILENKDKKNKYVVPVLSAVFIILVFSLGYIFGRFGFEAAWQNGEFSYSYKGNLNPETKTINFDLYWEVWETLNDKFVDRAIDEEEMFYGSIKGLAASLDDPATTFYTPDETSEYHDEKAGNLQGIGIEMKMWEKELIIQKVFLDSPAEKSGMMQGDVIKEVNGNKIEGLTSYEVAEKIRGEEGSSVAITLFRPIKEEEITVRPQRDGLHIKSVTWKKLKNNKVLIDIERFTESDLSAFSTAWDNVVNEVVNENPTGIVIDMRGNGGGFLEGAVYVAGEFLDRRSIVLYEQYRGGKMEANRVGRKGRLRNVPLVVLVNENTASAAEILAGALSYYNRAEIIGETTYGKGTAQEVVNLESVSGASVHVTTEKWLLPDKSWINKDNPIKPGIQVKITAEDIKFRKDPQLNRGMEELDK